MNKIKLGIVILSLSYGCANSLSEKQKEEYILKGNDIVKTSSKALESSLALEMKNGGVERAIPFCNSMALPLTEKLSKANKVQIKRTSDKIRNKKNMPNEEEKEILAYYKEHSQGNDPLEPIAKLNKQGSVSYYAPIVLHKKCLICHGTAGKELTYETDSIIKSYYKLDRATDYAAGDLRGIWSINFNN